MSAWTPAPANTSKGLEMNIKEIKEMLQLMNENGLTEFELEQDGIKVRLKKGAGGQIETTQEISNLTPQGGRNRATEPKEPVKTVVGPASKTSVVSPMVGTFYASPAPDAPPFLQVGSLVEIGQVICVIEAMKLMNEIKSEVRGKVAEILVNNGDPVEFNQPLFRLE